MTVVAYLLVAAPIVLFIYAYVVYPALLFVISRVRTRRAYQRDMADLPTVSISLPVYNEEAQIRAVIESLLAIDYPAHLRQIVVTSDASSDRTDAIVAEYADRGVELLRLPARAGKTTAENTAAPILRGDIVVNTDASIRIRPDALRRLVAEFTDPAVGVASGRDISVGSISSDPNIGEAGYVNYEMRVRALETQVNGIIGASGCFYAVRSHLHRMPLPSHLSRDFAAALIAREHGYRAVSVDDATCLVPRTGSLKREFRRKVRTMARGIETLTHKRHLLNPFRYGAFAWMLFSHKVCRWLLPVAGLVGLAGVIVLAFETVWARWVLAAEAMVIVLALIGWNWSERRPMPRILGVLTAGVLTQAATILSIVRAFHGDKNAAWEPTRREPASLQRQL